MDGATIYPFVLNFPQLPAGFKNIAYPQYAYETTGPGVTTADYGSGEVVAVDPNASKPLYSGYKPTGTGFAYTPIISSTTPDGLAAFDPQNDRPVRPGRDRQIYGLAAICAFGNSDGKFGGGCISELGADLAAPTQLDRPTGDGNSLSG